jgi:hypothetical protein
MTDILPRLAALTQKDENGLLPCAVCGHPNEVDGIKLTIESNRRRVVCTHCGMTTIWCDSAEHAIGAANNRPREAALVALVQEAAAENALLTALLDKFFFITNTPRGVLGVIVIFPRCPDVAVVHGHRLIYPSHAPNFSRQQLPV